MSTQDEAVTSNIDRGSTDGSAYDRPQPHVNKLLTEVGRGTPCGELMRRYWHPIAVSANLTSDRPRQIRILGEDLVLFRDRTGRAGLLYSRCAHRGTTLYYGKVEERGLRCCYHGWLYDVEGRCLDQPCEPNGGRARDTVRQPWYPVEERYGLVFAYMGPLAKKPVLPSYDILDDHEPGKSYEATIGGWGGTRDYSFEVVPYSWLQLLDNFMDPFHVFVLHSTFTGIQIRPEFATMPKIEFVRTPDGLSHTASRKLNDGREFQRVSSIIFPNIISVPFVDGLTTGRSRSISWCVPVDDTHHFQVLCGSDATKPEFGSRENNNTGRTWGEMSEQERRDFPNDFEAQMGQGVISLHSEEHLATSDIGVAMQRRLLTRQIQVVAEGGDPMNVCFDPATATVHVGAANNFKTAQATE
jgi:phenylpropionate dioxygenase-like ring-hydroxylating dioxygenase large terminal subunit